MNSTALWFAVPAALAFLGLRRISGDAAQSLALTGTAVLTGLSVTVEPVEERQS